MYDVIFEAVRREDVVLWIGSGFSIYAGYPSGARMTEILYEALTEPERADIPSGLSLVDLAEQFVRLKNGSRQMLISILSQQLTKKPSSITYHQLLSKIPHIRTIITTNYDQLFENAYGNRIHPIIEEKNIPYTNGRKELFKVHGDIQHPDSIVITSTDYRKLYQRNFATDLIWTTVKARIADKMLVFIGYDLEDENTKMILSSIMESLGPNRKQVFLIAPKLKPHKVNYLRDFKIEYVDSKGEIILDKLIKSIKDNIVTDFGKGWVGADTFGEFCRLHNLKPGLSSTATGFDLQSIVPLQEQFQQQVALSIRDAEKAKLFRDLVNGESPGSVTLDPDAIASLKVWINDVNIIRNDVPYQIILASQPNKTGTAAVIFNDGTEFTDISYEYFRTKNGFKVEARYKGGQFSFDVNGHTFDKAAHIASPDFHYQGPEIFPNTTDAVSCYQLLVNLSKGRTFKLYLDGSSKAYLMSQIEKVEPIPQLESPLSFFKNLKSIERAYDVRFTNIGDFTEKDFDNAGKAVAFANRVVVPIKWTEELTWGINPENPLELVEKVEEPGVVLTTLYQNSEQIKVLDQTINLGHLFIEGFDLYIVNKKEITGGQSSVARIKSKSGTVRLHYEINPPALAGQDSDDKNTLV